MKLTTPLPTRSTRKDQDEPYQEAYKAWAQQPGIAQNDQLLHAVTPIIDRAVYQYSQTPENPLLRSHAKRIVLASLPRYNPQQGPLRPFLYAQLHGLQRIAGRQQQTIPVPERVAISQQHLRETENLLRDELSRDPSDAEVADRAGISLKRIAYLRRYKPPLLEGQLQTDEDDEQGSPGVTLPHQAVAREQAIVDFLYDSLDDPIDRGVLEYSYGLHGAEKLPMSVAAKRLNRTPGAISQRATRLQQKLQELDAAGLF